RIYCQTVTAEPLHASLETGHGHRNLRDRRLRPERAGSAVGVPPRPSVSAKGAVSPRIRPRANSRRTGKPLAVVARARLAIVAGTRLPAYPNVVAACGYRVRSWRRVVRRRRCAADRARRAV